MPSSIFAHHHIRQTFAPTVTSALQISVFILVISSVFTSSFANPNEIKIYDKTITETFESATTTTTFEMNVALANKSRQLDIFSSERSILQNFYENTRGSKWWKNRTGWLEADNYCTWFGVSCTPSGTVQKIEFDTNHLNGTIPSDVFMLQDLTVLDIFNESAVDIKFEHFKEAKKLTDLYLYNTNVTSLDGLGRMSNSSLQILLVKYSKNLRGSIPNEIGSLVNLFSLSVTNNPKLEGTIPESIGKLTKLRNLDLYYNRLNNQLPLSIANLEELVVLNAEGNFLTGQIPYNIGNIQSLQEIHLGFNDFVGTLPKGISLLPNLQILKLGPMDVRPYKERKFGLKGKLLDFSDAPSLHYLDLSYNKFTGSIPRSILDNNIENTKYTIYLESNRISGVIPKELYRFKTLDINVDGNVLTGNELSFKELNKTKPEAEDFNDMVYQWNKPALYWYGMDGLACKPGDALNIDKYDGNSFHWWHPCERCDIWFINNTFFYDENLLRGETDFKKYAPYWGSKECNLMYNNGTKTHKWDFMNNSTSAVKGIEAYSVGLTLVALLFNLQLFF